MAKKRTHYLNNKDLKAELVKSSEQGVPTEQLHLMFFSLAKNIATKGNFRNYTYIEDMISEAYIRCITKSTCFDLTKENPFSYFTTVVVNTFLRFISKEKGYQVKKWNELRKLETRMRVIYGIEFSLNDNIREKMEG